MSTVKRNLQCKFRGFTSRHKRLITLMQKGQIRLEQDCFWKWNQDQLVLGCWEDKCMEKERIQSIPHLSIMMGRGIYGCLVFIYDVTEERSSRMNSEIYTVIFYSYCLIKCCKDHRTACHSSENKPKQTNKRRKQSIQFQHSFHLLQVVIEGFLCFCVDSGDHVYWPFAWFS